MGFCTQAILPGHLSVEALAESLTALPGVTLLEWRRMHHPDHVVFEISTSEGHLSVEAFMNSYAASDHARAYTGRSILLSAEYGRASLDILSDLAGREGFVRKHEMAEWQRIQSDR